MKRFLVTILLALVATGLFSLYLINRQEPNAPQQPATDPDTSATLTETTPKEATPEFIAPTKKFSERVTKKKFGTYITPASSPVQPERFSGYHTGVDVEFEDVDTNVNVRAITRGTVVHSGFVSGYGGLLVIEHRINGENRAVLYGHLNQATLPAVGTSVKKGQKVGVLGANKSAETDGERKHLHFAVLKNTQINFAGYVQTKAELSSWLNPLSLYN